MGTASHWSTESPAPFAAQLAEIEVDIDTGQITVNKLCHGRGLRRGDQLCDS